MAIIMQPMIPPAGSTEPPVRSRGRRKGPARYRRSRWAEARRSWRLHWQLYLLVIVPVAYFVIFKYVPISMAVIAFKDYNVIKGPWGSDWVGFKNFELLFTNPVFGTLVKNTFILAFYLVLASFPIPIILAIAVNEIRNGWFKRSVQLFT
ncbi:MAG: putative aldouronate transport system permease protein, partial [Micromonosporaceae bacterium]|nr:putative aldouronate transport system permease protein [Micromonosporaceae bacterium]